MTGYGPPNDPSEAPTGLYDYSGNGDQQPPQPQAPWYRNPIVLVALALFAAILLGLAFYLLADRTQGSGGTTQSPTSPTMSTMMPTSSTVVTSSAEPVAPPQSTMTTVPPGTTEPTTAPAATPTTTVDEGRHHHHHHGGGTP